MLPCACVALSVVGPREFQEADIFPWRELVCNEECILGRCFPVFVARGEFAEVPNDRRLSFLFFPLLAQIQPTKIWAHDTPLFLS